MVVLKKSESDKPKSVESTVEDKALKAEKEKLQKELEESKKKVEELEKSVKEEKDKVDQEKKKAVKDKKTIEDGMFDNDRINSFYIFIMLKVKHIAGDPDLNLGDKSATPN